MGIKLVLFDMDGVLVNAKDIHYRALNFALGPKYEISEQDHHTIYDGLPTKDKLERLTIIKGLPEGEYENIWKRKQNITIELFKEFFPNPEITNLLKQLHKDGYKIGCCSNSIRKTILVALAQLQIIEYFDIILSNEDVQNPKPHPEIYWKAIASSKMLPQETLILEDNPNGLLAASKSGAHVMRISSIKHDVTIEKVYKKISEIISFLKIPTAPPIKWNNTKMNILIPMAGAGSRFESAGYTFPKPLIEIHGKPMIQLVVENIALNANYIFIVQKTHRKKYNLDVILNIIAPNCKIVNVDGITEGAACTTLLAKDLINTESPLFIANSDQFVEWDSSKFMYRMQEAKVDGGILTFESIHPKWSYAKINHYGRVIEVAEKTPISNHATVGFYWWKKGSDYVSCAEQMIAKNIRINNEFYVCPVFNEAIKNELSIITHDVEKMWGLGDPDSLKYFLENYKVKQ
jgi:HAD superfamily hydrolase (TIGR01509 family)